MNNYIMWNKADDTAFREYYFQKTGEMVQDDPIDADTKWQIGSSRISSAELIELQNFHGVIITTTPTTYKSQQQLDQQAATLLLVQEP